MKSFVIFALLVVVFCPSFARKKQILEAKNLGRQAFEFKPEEVRMNVQDDDRYIHFGVAILVNSENDDFFHADNDVILFGQEVLQEKEAHPVFWELPYIDALGEWFRFHIEYAKSSGATLFFDPRWAKTKRSHYAIRVRNKSIEQMEEFFEKDRPASNPNRLTILNSRK